MSLSQNDSRIEAREQQDSIQNEWVSENVVVAAVSANSNRTFEDTHLFSDREFSSTTLSMDQAFAHMVKAMLGTGLLSLPYAFKHSGLYLGLILLVVICFVCLHCMRVLVFAAHYVCVNKGKSEVDYANVMRAVVEDGPLWISRRGYFFKQLVNVEMFIAQLGFCCVYFVFMADNLKDFFDNNSGIHLPKSVWMFLLLPPILAICSIRRLKVLAPFAYFANIIYLVAVSIVLYCFFTNLQPASTMTKFGKFTDLPLFFGTVLFAFEGICVILPIENKMVSPDAFIAWNGVLNSSCLTVLAIFSVTGFYGYLAFGENTKETVTLNLPDTRFFAILKIMFVLCVMVSYPLQLFVPMERIQKFITRKCLHENQIRNIFIARFSIVFITCAIAELVPHLALFISLVGAVACTSLALLFPPIIDILVCYSKGKLTPIVWLRNAVIFGFAIIGFVTGTYSAIHDIVQTFY